MNKEIFFYNIFGKLMPTGSATDGKFMRTIDAVNEINIQYNNKYKNKLTITNNITSIKNSFIIFIKCDFTKNIEYIRKSKNNNNNNIIIVDVIDWLEDINNDNYDFPDLLINNIIDLIDVFICENEYVKNRYEKKYNKPCFIIKHHYDKRWHQLKKNDNSQEKLSIVFNGYMGHKNNNCLHINKLVENNIVTNNLKKYGQYHLVLKAEEGLHNCHISIRDKDSWEYNIKPSIKIKTAAVLNCNIITTNDISVKELLKKVDGTDYPYLLQSSEYNEVINMIKYAEKTYKTDIWYRGLEIMKKIKDNYDISIIVKDYYLPFFDFLFNKYC